jgi:phosphoserine phosphatase
MDGVIFEGDNFWIELHKLFGTERQGLFLAKKYMQSSYEYMASIVAGRLWKGKESSAYEKLIKERIYHPGIKKVFDYLHQRHILSAIISTGSFDLAKRAQLELGIDEIRANKLEIENGILTGKVDIQVVEGQKYKIGLELVSAFNTLPQCTAFVGDSDSDIDLAKVVYLPIAYNSKSVELNTVAKYSLAYGNLEGIINILNQNREFSD